MTRSTRPYAGVLTASLACALTAGLLAAGSPAHAMRPDNLSRARSVTHEDSYYPADGDPGVDALHYDLSLAWQATTRRLTGSETLTFRATRTATQFQLDLSGALKVSSVTLGGVTVPFTHPGKNLVVTAPVTQDERYVLQVGYSGVPEPVKAPTTRDDLPKEGLTPDRDGSAWTIQEPYGAFTWYAVDDQPADKAFYDFELATPAAMTGVANGTMTSDKVIDGRRITDWHLGDPASSYLTTVAFGKYTITTARSASGVPFTFATPVGDTQELKALRFAPTGLTWLEHKLGRFPFQSLGAVIVPTTSAEETETMMTIGDDTYDYARDTLVHEMAHQWYGDEITPGDWVDVWMNEGMATYLQALWGLRFEPKAYGTHDELFAYYARADRRDRRVYGPAAAYRRGDFASNNVYLGPALMWDQLRKKLGDKLFFAMIKAWPQVHAYGSSDRVAYTRWISAYTHTDLTRFFHDWLLGKKQPKLIE